MDLFRQGRIVGLGGLLVRLDRLRILLLGVVIFAHVEIRFRRQRTRGVLLGQRGKRLHGGRLVGLRSVGPAQFVQHFVGARVIGLLRQQRRQGLAWPSRYSPLAASASPRSYSASARCAAWGLAARYWSMIGDGFGEFLLLPVAHAARQQRVRAQRMLRVLIDQRRETGRRRLVLAGLQRSPSLCRTARTGRRSIADTSGSLARRPRRPPDIDRPHSDTRPDGSTPGRPARSPGRS